MNVSEIIGQVVGFANRIDTPFGELCSLSCDMHRLGRAYTPIEDSIAKLTPMLTQRNQRHSFQGNLVATLTNYSTNSILEFLGTSSKTHSIEDAGSHAMSAYTLLCSKLVQQQEDPLPPQKPQVYTSKHEEYWNVLPWKFSECEIHPIDVAENSAASTSAAEIDQPQISTSLIEELSKHTEKKMHIISISGVSAHSGQKLPSLAAIIESSRGLKAELEQINKELRIYVVLDITGLISVEKINIRNDNAYKYVDFFVVQGVQLLGGGIASTNILVSNKKSTEEVQKVPRYQNNQDVRKLYRLALQLQLLDSLNVESLGQKERDNVSLFLEGIKSANAELLANNPLREIVVSGIEESHKQNSRLGGFNLNLYVPTSEIFDPENKPYLHPSLVCQLLHDLFGILAVPTTHVYIAGAKKESGVVAVPEATTNSSQSNDNDSIAMMMNLPVQLTAMLGALGISECSVGGVCVSISYLHSEEEVNYIVNCLKMVCEKGEDFLKFYDKKTFQMNGYSLEKYDFGFNSMAKITGLPADFVEKRQQKYNNQESVAKTVFKNLNRYFSVNDTYSKEKTEQHKRKDYAATMPNVLKSKLTKEDEISLTLSAVAIQRAQALIKNELAQIKKEKNVKEEPEEVVEVVRLPSPPKPTPPPPEPTGPSKEEMEAQMKALLEARMIEQKQSEAATIAQAMEAIRREMEERLQASSNPKEKLIFEDAPPSVLFKNVLDHREKRYRHLREIFNHYAKLTQQASKQPDQRIRLIPPSSSDTLSYQQHQQQSQQHQHASQTVSQTIYIKFCMDFSLLNELVDVNVLCSIFATSLSSTTKVKPIATTVHISKEMMFTEFLNSLEKLSLVFFHNHHLLITSFDKMEALYQFMQIDDILVLRKKMSAQQQQQPQQPQQTSPHRNHNSSYSKNHNHHHHQSASPPSRSSHYANDLSSSTYLSTIQPSRQQHGQSLSQDRRSVQDDNKSRVIDWNDGSDNKNTTRNVKNKQGSDPFSYMKHDTLNSSSHYNNNGVNDYQSLDSASVYTNNLNSRHTKQGLLPLNSPPSQSSKFQSISQQQRGSELRSQAAGKQHSAAMLRIKQIEEQEKKKQQDLMAFLQSNSQNKRYKPYKKMV